MAIRTISVIVRPDETKLDDGRVVIQRLLRDWIGSHFVPVAVSGLWDALTLSGLPTAAGRDWNGLALWPGESEGSGVLTELGRPDFSFRDRLLTSTPEGEFGCTFRGGLLHQPTLPGYARGWYGRAKIAGTARRGPLLWELADVGVEWSDIDHRVAVRFPLAGYPVTRAVPQKDVESAIQEASLPILVEENRRDLFGWVARIPECLGWSPPVEWEINAHDALFDDDVDPLREWQRHLQEEDMNRCRRSSSTT